MRCAAASGERLRQRLRHLRRAHARRARRPCPCRSFEEAREGAHAGERAHQRAALDALGAPRRHEGAHVLRRQLGERAQRRRAAEMLGQESEELAHVAPVGFDRLGRHAPLAAEMPEPARDLGRDIGRGKGSSGLLVGLAGHEVIVPPLRSLIVKLAGLASCSGVMPAKAGIQYSRACRVLDHPPSRMMTAW